MYRIRELISSADMGNLGHEVRLITGHDFCIRLSDGFVEITFIGGDLLVTEHALAAVEILDGRTVVFTTVKGVAGCTGVGSEEMFAACEGNPLELLFFLFAELGNCGIWLDVNYEMIGCQLFLITRAFVADGGISLGSGIRRAVSHRHFRNGGDRCADDSVVSAPAEGRQVVFAAVTEV